MPPDNDSADNRDTLSQERKAAAAQAPQSAATRVRDMFRDAAKKVSSPIRGLAADSANQKAAHAMFERDMKQSGSLIPPGMDSVNNPDGSLDVRRLARDQFPSSVMAGGADDSLHGFHLPARPGQPTVVFFGGTDFNRDSPTYKTAISEMASKAKAQGMGFAVYDYPPGLNEDKLRQHTQDVISHLESQGVPAHLQSYAGYSLGAYPALVAANLNPEAAGLHITSTFSSARQFSKELIDENKFGFLVDKTKLDHKLDNIAEVDKLCAAQSLRAEGPMPVGVVFSEHEDFGKMEYGEAKNRHMAPLTERLQQNYPDAANSVNVTISGSNGYQLGDRQLDAHAGILHADDRKNSFDGFLHQANDRGMAQQAAKQAQGVVAPSPVVTPPPVMPIVVPLDNSPLPSRAPPPLPVEEVPDLSANRDLRFPPPPSYPPPPPPDDQDIAGLNQSSTLPQQAASSIPPGVGFTEADVDDLIQKHVPAKQLQGADVPDYRGIAGTACQRTLQSPGEQKDKRLESAVEMRLIEKNEILPLKQMLAQEESKLEALQSTPGIQPDDPRILSQEDRVEELQEDLNGWQARVTTLQGSLQMESRQDRLAAINAGQTVLNEKASLKSSKAVSSSDANVSFGDAVKLNDGNPRQQYELKLAAAGTAQDLMVKMPSAGLQRGELESKIKTAYGSAYQYEGPKRYTEEGDDQRVKGANDRGIRSAEIKAIADEMQPVIDQVNEIQQKLGPLQDDYAQMRYDARQGFEKDLSTIPDPGVRSIAQQAQDRITDLTEKVTQCDNQITALADPRLGVIHDAETLNTIKKEIQDEKQNLMTQRTAAREQLAGSLDQAVATEMQQNGGAQIAQEVATLQQDQAALLTAFRDQKINEAAAIKPARVEQTPGYEPTTFRLDKPGPSVEAEDVPAGKMTRLRDVTQEMQNDYKDLKKQLGKKDLEPDAKTEIQQRMAEMREQAPGLAQLDRGMLARNLHSGLRDASQAVSRVGDTLNSARQSAVTSVSDRFRVMNINRDIGKLDDKITDIKAQRDQLAQDKQTFQQKTMVLSMVSGPGSFSQEEVDAIIKERLMEEYGQKEDMSLDQLRELGNEKVAEFDAKLEKLDSELQKAEAKVETLKEQKDAIKNKKDVSQNQGQAVQQKF